MEKSVTASKQVLRFTAIELKVSGQTLAGKMVKREGGLSFVHNIFFNLKSIITPNPLRNLGLFFIAYGLKLF